MQKMNPLVAGLSQALGIIIYIIIVSNAMLKLGQLLSDMPNALGMSLVLTLLVFSATVCGSLVFGYPVYLLIKGNIKDCLRVLASTIVSLLVLGVLIGLIISLF